MSEENKGKVHMNGETIVLFLVLLIPVLIVNIIELLLYVFLIAVILFLVFGIIAFAVAGIFELIFGVTMVGIGVEKLFTMPMAAFAIMGFGIVNIGVALLMECIVVWLFGVLLPSLMKSVMSKGGKHEEAA